MCSRKDNKVVVRDLRPAVNPEERKYNSEATGTYVGPAFPLAAGTAPHYMVGWGQGVNAMYEK